MANILWPQELPLPQITTYTLERQQNIIKTEMESGPIRYRLRFLNSSYTLNANWLFSEQEFQFFETWFDETLTKGMEWFSISLIPSPFASALARFQCAYTAQALSSISWEIRAPLEIKKSGV